MRFLFLSFIAGLLFTSSVWGQSVTWTSDRATPSSGTASGTNSWTMAPLTLAPGINNVTVTADDGSGNRGSASIAINYIPTFPGNTLAGAWGFEDAPGPTVADSSGNANTGSLVNAPTRATGRYGNGVLLNGTSQYVNVPDSNSLDFTQSWTIVAWVKPAQVHNDFRSIIEKSSSGGVNQPFVLYASIAGAGYGCADGVPAVWVQVNAAQSLYVCDTTPLPIGVATFIAATYDSAAGQLKLYRNGDAPIVTSVTGITEPTALPLYIGRSEFGEYFDGVIDEVRLYNFALPVTAASNTTFGVNCSTANQTDQNNVATASLTGAANCPISILVAPPTIAFGASSTVEFGATNSGISFGSTP